MVEDWDTTVLVFTKQEKTHQRLTIFRESCWLWKWVRWARCDNSTDGGAAENCSRVTCLQVASTGQLQLTVAMWHPWTYVAKSSNFSKKPEILIIMYNLLIFKCWQFIVVRTIEGAILQSLIDPIMPMDIRESMEASPTFNPAYREHPLPSYAMMPVSPH